METGAPTVLVVEDDASVRHLVARVLVERGFDVTSTGLPDEARELFSRTRFAALLVDKNLPGASGLDLAQEARQRWPDLPVVLMTAYPEAGLLSRLPLDGYLAKPFRNILDVPDTIQRALDRRAQQAQVAKLQASLAAVVPRGATPDRD